MFSTSLHDIAGQLLQILRGHLVIAIGDEMFGCRSYLHVGLKSLSHGDAQFCYQIRAFSINLFVASPALVTAYVQDGGIYVGVPQ